MSKGSSTITFSVYVDGKLIEAVTFDRPIINVGKLSTATLRLDDINVSRKHAVIEQREDGRWRVTDLGSTNGTLLRGERVVQAELADGDRLVLGATTLVVHLAKEPKAVAATAAKGETARGLTTTPPTATHGEAPPPLPAVRAARAEPVEEIRGLGAGSFYQKKAATNASAWALDVALLWGDTVLASKAFMQVGDVVLGEDERADFAIPREVLGGTSFTLVRGTPAGFALDLSNPNVSGDVLLGERVRAVGELAAESPSLPLKGAMRARLAVGDFTLLVAHTPLVTAAPVKRTLDKDAALFIGLSAVVQLAFLIIAWSAPDDLLMGTRDPRADRQRVVQALRITPEQLREEQEAEKPRELELRKVEPEERDPTLEVDRTTLPTPPEVKPTTEREARPIVDRLRRERERDDPTRLSPADREARAKELAQATSLAKAFRDNNPLLDRLMTDLDAQPSPFKSLGMNDPSGGDPSDGGGNVSPFSGFDASDNSWLPSEGGPDAPPSGPIVPSLAKPSDRTLGPVPLKDIPRGPEFPEPPRVHGGELDAATVLLHIRRQLSGLKWCYQDRLQVNRSLAGKGTLAFTIMPNGTTLDARVRNSSFGDAALESCMATKMSRWKFPSPSEGGTVDVEYPIILKAP